MSSQESEHKIENKMFKHVLIVDDNEIDIFIAEKILQQSNFAIKITSKRTVSDAIHYLSTNSEEAPDLIFLDLILPIQNGYEFLDEFSKTTISVNSKIVILSVLMNGDEMELLKINPLIHSVLQKPLSHEAINKLKDSIDSNIRINKINWQSTNENP